MQRTRDHAQTHQQIETDFHESRGSSVTTPQQENSAPLSVNMPCLANASARATSGEGHHCKATFPENRKIMNCVNVARKHGAKHHYHHAGRRTSPFMMSCGCQLLSKDTCLRTPTNRRTNRQKLTRCSICCGRHLLCDILTGCRQDALHILRYQARDARLHALCIPCLANPFRGRMVHTIRDACQNYEICC